MFEGWDSFYLMVGPAGGGLIGLLFVVVTLTQGFDQSLAARGVNLYMTPTAVHFAVVMTISAAALAPGLTPAETAAVFGLAALVGLGNAARACLGIGRPGPGAEPPHWSDFWLYGAVPAAVYVALLAAVAGVWAHETWAARAIAALLVILLLVGIRNAWDLITWMAPRMKSGD